MNVDRVVPVGDLLTKDLVFSVGIFEHFTSLFSKLGCYYMLLSPLRYIYNGYLIFVLYRITNILFGQGME